ncbi:hypothetical protein G6F50_018393 [Rhizopus delemar]|uniref:Uncharacterized protein n=1 Tax=Rhizopus delemar TaxID=936053 RepID=A0A9P6XMX8_9FUNG|nr:hypothetical protein G6F50_018393 [Rhizopus delemar]
MRRPGPLHPRPISVAPERVAGHVAQRHRLRAGRDRPPGAGRFAPGRGSRQPDERRVSGGRHVGGAIRQDRRDVLRQCSRKRR